MEKEFCEKHGEYEVLKKELFGVEIKTECPDCAEEFEKSEQAKQEQEANERAVRRLRSLNIEPMYFDASLKTFEAGSEEQKRALAYSQEMVGNRCGKLVLLGDHGTGKTHLAVGVVRELGGALYTMYEITTRIRASYVGGAKETELDIVNELARLPMLAIDEIGRTKGSDAETNWLSFLVDKRHTRGLPLILISNKHTRKSCKEGGCGGCLENYVSEDVLSRLSEDGHLVNMVGVDYRRKKRKK